MRKFIIVILAFGFFGGFTAWGQAVRKSAASEKILEVAPREEVYLHYNSSLLFPGEYLLYKVYTLSGKDSSKNYSELSNIAYVELIGEDGDLVFSHKVQLDQGTGQADFFVPTTVASGNYKLISYTNWMKNWPGNFYETDITIINPYQSRQKNLLGPIKAELSQPQAVRETQKKDSPFLELFKNIFQKREKVVLKVKEIGKKVGPGKYSLSVRKLDGLTTGKNKTSHSLGVSQERRAEESRDSVFLPELRGHLIQGEIVARNDSQRKLNGIKVALSLPSENALPIVAATDEKGKFYFNLEKDTRSSQAIIEILGAQKEEFEVKLNKHSPIAVSHLDFGSFYLSPQMEKAILERSVYNQIENAFFSVKPDSLQPAVPKEPVYKQLVQTYKLDDYKRFKTVPETFVEIINSSWIKKDSEGKMHFKVRGIENNLHLGLDPLVVIDGVLIQDHDDLAYMNSGRIEKISIIREKLFLGPQVFQGGVLVETIDGDYNKDYKNSFARKLQLGLAEVEKKYFKQEYGDENLKGHIPDFRYQLLWLPELNFGEEDREKTIEFYTSDVEGTFEIVLEGFNYRGEAISLRKEFRVGSEKNE